MSTKRKGCNIEINQDVVTKANRDRLKEPTAQDFLSEIIEESSNEDPQFKCKVAAAYERRLRRIL